MQLESGDGPCHNVTLDFGLLNQRPDFRPIDLIGQGAHDDQNGAVNLRKVNLDKCVFFTNIRR